MSCQQSVIPINILLNRFKSALKRFLKSISCPYVMLCYVMLCYVMLCYVMFCYVMTTVNRLHERESKTVLDSKFHSLESRSPDTGFQIPSVIGSWIKDSNR